MKTYIVPPIIPIVALYYDDVSEVIIKVRHSSKETIFTEDDLIDTGYRMLFKQKSTIAKIFSVACDMLDQTNCLFFRSNKHIGWFLVVCASNVEVIES